MLKLLTGWSSALPPSGTMSDLYTALRVSPKKKRTLPTSDDEDVLTPKRLRRNSILFVDYTLLQTRVHLTSRRSDRLPHPLPHVGKSTRRSMLTAYLPTYLVSTRCKHLYNTLYHTRSQPAPFRLPKIQVSFGTCSTTCLLVPTLDLRLELRSMT